MSYQDELSLVLDLIQTRWITNCCCVAAAGLIFYDYITNFAREIALMWGRKLSSVTMLFYLNRWTLITWAICGLLTSDLTNLKVESTLTLSIAGCVELGHLVSALDIILESLWAVFSAVRVYAVSGGSWWLALVVGALSAVPVGTNTYYLFAVEKNSLVSIPFIGVACFTSISLTEAQTTRFAISTRICTITADVLILLVTWYKTYATKRMADRHNIDTPLATMLLRDGTAYFVLLLCLNILNMVGIATEVFSTASIFITPLSSIIISHVLLDLRHLGHEPLDDPEIESYISFRHTNGQIGSQSASLRFASFVDNMGEDLGTHMDPDVEWDTIHGDR